MLNEKHEIGWNNIAFEEHARVLFGEGKLTIVNRIHLSEVEDPKRVIQMLAQTNPNKIITYSSKEVRDYELNHLKEIIVGVYELRKPL